MSDVGGGMLFDWTTVPLLDPTGMSGDLQVWDPDEQQVRTFPVGALRRFYRVDGEPVVDVLHPSGSTLPLTGEVAKNLHMVWASVSLKAAQQSSQKEAIMEIEPKALERHIAEHWLSRGGAARLLDASPEWVRTLGDTGRVTTIDTPLGKLYSRQDTERIARQREQRQGRD